jgi:hypothetical protein
MSDLASIVAALKSNLAAFNVQCYIPAVNKWSNFWRDKTKPADLLALENAFGIEDIGWMGSRILAETPGLYAPCGNVGQCGSSLQSSDPIQGVVWDNARDGQRMSWMPPNTPGRPYCGQWWNTLRGQVYDEMADTLTQINAIMGANGLDLWSSTFGGSTTLGIYSAEDMLAKVALSRSNADELFSDDLSYYTGKVKSDNGVAATLGKVVSKGATEFVAWTGNIVSQPFASAETLTQNNLQQITQAVVLLALYLAFPFIALFSGLRLQVLFSYCVLVMSVINWQMWWSITMWIDSNLLMSMYPDNASFLNYVEELGSKRMLLDRVTNGLAMFAPSIWTFILSVCGWKAADALGKFTAGFAARNKDIAKEVSQKGLAAVQAIANIVAPLVLQLPKE